MGISKNGILVFTSSAFLFMIFSLTGSDGFGQLNSAFALSDPNGNLGRNVFVEIAKKHNPAVVNVSVKAKRQEMKTRPPHFRFGPGPSPRFGPSPRRPDRNPGGGMGSGFIIDPEGYILTNHHVIEGADTIKIKLQDNQEYQAELIGSDSKTDIALLKISEKSSSRRFPSLNMANSDALEVGEWVMAIGNPFGLDHTVTVGVVSAKERNINQGPYDEFIQTDASINPGNSGGPLINTSGEVVGINTAIISNFSGGNVGIGFATPINVAKAILSDLKNNGRVTRGWLGVMIQRLTPELADNFGIEHSNGALVGDVIPDSPASKSGIQRGDIIVSFNEKTVKDFNALPKLVATVRPGTTVPVKVIREGKNQNLDVTIDLLEEKALKTASLGDSLGLQVQELTPELANSMGLEETEGVLVTEVERDKSGAESGVKRGDVVLEVNRKAVRSPAEYQKEIGKAKKNDAVLLLVRRGNSSIYIAVR
tara:strand:+ start:172 stop:1611 length:1440 start_codon:yes stop_codon:yes gene_type:complete